MLEVILQCVCVCVCVWYLEFDTRSRSRWNNRSDHLYTHHQIYKRLHRCLSRVEGTGGLQ